MDKRLVEEDILANILSGRGRRKDIAGFDSGKKKRNKEKNKEREKERERRKRKEGRQASSSDLPAITP